MRLAIRIGDKRKRSVARKVVVELAGKTEAPVVESLPAGMQLVGRATVLRAGTSVRQDVPLGEVQLAVRRKPER